MMEDSADDYLLRGILGAALAGVAVASAYYLTRPVPETPLVPLHNQSPVLEVSSNCFIFLFVLLHYNNK